MNSLRARITLMLIISNVCVVALSSFVIYLVMTALHSDHFVAPTAHLIADIAEVLDNGKSANRLIVDAPPAGLSEPRLTAMLRGKLRDLGISNDVLLIKPPGTRAMVASVRLTTGRWLVLPVAKLSPPPSAVYAIAGLMLLVITGSALVGFGLGKRVTRPLLLLEGMANDIEADGHAATVAETGPAEFRATARALNRLTARLKGAMESRMRLVAAAGHDLRTPMTRMRLRAEFLPEEDRVQWLNDLQELDHIADSAIRLVREEGQEKSQEQFRLDELTRTICAELHDMGFSVRLRSASLVNTTGARFALTRALRNLIINAARHGGGAEVDVGFSDEGALIVIEDNGPGIPADVLTRVFEPFFRADPARRQLVPGAGLGLAIAKEIIERQDGTITLANRASGGLRQEVCLRRVAA